MKCASCRQRKGRRFCPAKDAAICTQCCGEKRVLEIDCPESCEYLRIGRAREAELEQTRHAQVLEPPEVEKWRRVLDVFGDVMADLQVIIAEERRASRDLKDNDVAEALDCLIRTLRTEDRGVIYQTTSDNLRAEGLRRQFAQLMESCRRPEETDRPRIHLKDAIEILEVLRGVVGNHMEAGSFPLPFVDFLARRMPRESRMGPAQPSIIIPGR